MQTFLITLLLGIFFSQSAVSQGNRPVTKASFGKGIDFTTADSSFQFKFTLRIQPQAQANFGLAPEFRRTGSEAMIRRGRLKFSGYAYTPKLTYKVELGYTNRDMESTGRSADFPSSCLDAYMTWNFYRELGFTFGQFKVPGNHERVVSSGNLEFVDRSIVNATFNLDRDIGIMFSNEFLIGKAVFRQMAAWTIGEGRNRNTAPGGFSYTGRVEFLPFGEFATKKADYTQADLGRESKPKLIIGLNANYNDDADRTGGQLGSRLYEQRDIITYQADAMLKYKGFSTYMEYGKRECLDPVTMDPKDSNRTQIVYAGTGLNAQASYVFKSHYQLAARWSRLLPDNSVAAYELPRTDYTLGFSKYIVGHNLKVQTDFTYSASEGGEDNFFARLSMNFEL
ncbi:MAG: OprO/OprP family phosphate-selective porin [Bacteroidota bacterium]|nr:OprO/OprP family phosphate-selective porin [Bacteroidota bacterium]